MKHLEDHPSLCLLTLAQTAARLGVAPRTLDRIVAEGGLRRINLGTAKRPTWRIDAEELRRYVESRSGW